MEVNLNVRIYGYIKKKKKKSRILKTNNFTG